MEKYEIIEDMITEWHSHLLKILLIDKTVFWEAFSELRKSPEKEGKKNCQIGCTFSLSIPGWSRGGKT